MRIFFKIIYCLFFFISCNEKEIIIQPTDGYLKLIYPAGGEYFSINDTIPIIWQSNLSEPLFIQFSSNYGSKWTMIANSIQNGLGIYVWKTPNVISNSCLIKISTTSFMDSTKNSFSLNVPTYFIEKLEYYPLSISNKWVYLSRYPTNPTVYSYITVISDTIINQERFFVLEYEIYTSKYYRYERADTLSGNIIRREGNIERIIDNLYAQVGDLIPAIRYDGSDSPTLFEKEETINLYGSIRNIRTYYNDGFPDRFRYTLVKGIGLYTSNIWVHMIGNLTDTLCAARVNNIIYGDSTLLR